MEANAVHIIKTPKVTNEKAVFGFDIVAFLSISECGRRLGLAESRTVFSRENEGPNHFCLGEITVKGVQFRQPELVTAVICVRSIGGIATQVAEVLHQHK